MQTYTRWTVFGPVTGTCRALVLAAAAAVESSRRPVEVTASMPTQRVPAIERELLAA